MQKFKFSEYGRVIYRWKGNFVLIKNYYKCYSQKQTQKKLQTLETSLLCYGQPDIKNACLPVDAICQQIIFNTKQFSRATRSNSCKEVINVRHPRGAECPIIQYMTIKLYSTVRSKTLIQVLFSFGIVLSYDRVLSFIDELSQSAKVLYQDSDNKVLSSKMVFSQYLLTITLTRIVPLLMQQNISMALECL